MVDIVLATVNARYAHASLGLRCLRANLGAWRERSQIVEFTLEERAADMAERLLALAPKIVGLGVYIWNARIVAELVGILKRLRPELIVVLGGPEVSYDLATSGVVTLADYVVTGEGEESFPELVGRLFNNTPPAHKVVPGRQPDLQSLVLPYAEFSDIDLAQRTIYVEASRGCVFGCEFCLSSLDRHVRRVPLERFLLAMEQLWQRGLRHFRFVDRTFNLNPDTSQRLLDFFASRACPDLFVHVEVIADLLPPELLATMTRFPAGSLQLEVGVQSLNDDVVANIGRNQKAERVVRAIATLRTQTAVHLHVDLIVGLPGEDLESLALSFDHLYATQPHEIQVGILKRLRGATIARHDAAWQMVYATEPPYELLQNKCFDFALLQRLKRFARYWDLVANSGRFPHVAAVVCKGPSPFVAFLAFADWLFAKIARTHQIALDRLASLLCTYLVEQRGLTADEAQALLDKDYGCNSRRRATGSLPQAESTHQRAGHLTDRSAQRLKRQARHQR